MADNTTLNVGAGGDVIASNDISGVKYQRFKVNFGAPGASSDVSETNPLPVFGPDAVTTGSIAVTDSVGTAPLGAGAFINAASTAGSTVSLFCQGGDTAWNVQLTGTWTGTIYFEGSLDSTNGIDGNWINVNGRQTGIVNTVLSGNTTVNGMYRGNTSGVRYFRVRAVGTWSGTAAIVIRISEGVGAIFLNASVPAGSNNIGRITKSTDIDRTAITLTYNATNPVVAETLLSLVRTANSVAATGATSISVTSGKKLRITNIIITLRATVATSPFGSFFLRSLATGPTLIGSPLLFRAEVGGNAAVIGNTANMSIALVEAYEFSGTQTLGVSFSNNLVSNVASISLIGYEY